MEHIVLLFFSFFTEAVTLWQYATSLFIPSCSNKIRLPILSALYAILFFLSLLGEMGLNTFSFFVVNTVFLFALFKLKLLLAIFHSVILTSIMGISELAAFGIMSRFFPEFSLRGKCRTCFLYCFQQDFLFCNHLFISSSTPREKNESGTVCAV